MQTHIIILLSTMNAGNHNYYVYMLTNKHKTVLYTGITNNLATRLNQHLSKVKVSSFTYKYNVGFLVYYERFQYVQHAIDREKEIKGWRRSKKEDLIKSFNPEWRFLNEEVF